MATAVFKLLKTANIISLSTNARRAVQKIQVVAHTNTDSNHADLNTNFLVGKQKKKQKRSQSLRRKKRGGKIIIIAKFKFLFCFSPYSFLINSSSFVRVFLFAFVLSNYFLLKHSHTELDAGNLKLAQDFIFTHIHTKAFASGTHQFFFLLFFNVQKKYTSL